MYSSKSPHLDPKPWVPFGQDENSVKTLRVNESQKERKTLYKFRPRLQFTYKQTNQPNAILLGFRLMVQKTPEPYPGWYLQKVIEWSQREFPYESALEEQHARKVLTRLAAVIQSSSE